MSRYFAGRGKQTWKEKRKKDHVRIRKIGVRKQQFLQRGSPLQGKKRKVQKHFIKEKGEGVLRGEGTSLRCIAQRSLIPKERKGVGVLQSWEEKGRKGKRKVGGRRLVWEGANIFAKGATPSAKGWWGGK